MATNAFVLALILSHALMQTACALPLIHKFNCLSPGFCPSLSLLPLLARQDRSSTRAFSNIVWQQRSTFFVFLNFRCELDCSKDSSMREQHLNDLVKGIGLTPVATNETKDPALAVKCLRKKRPKTQRYRGARGDAQKVVRSATFTLHSVAVPMQAQLDYARDGHTALRSFLPADLLLCLRRELKEHSRTKLLDAWKQKVAVAACSEQELDGLQTIKQCKAKLAELGIFAEDEIPFLQFFNTWRYLSVVEALCRSARMGHAASQLLGVKQVRLYQDSLFYKRRNDGKTPWHVDARMAPFDTSNMCTFWIPLQHVPRPEKGGTGLVFVDKSHADFALPYWNNFGNDEYSRLEKRYGDEAVKDHMPMTIGDVTVHSGWTLHCADSNNSATASDRYALAITYVDARAEIREDIDLISGTKSKLSDDEDQSSFSSWINDVPRRRTFTHRLVPDVWPRETSTFTQY